MEQRAVATRFAGKVAIVTGGVGGIGRAISERLVREGGTVLVADLTPGEELRAALGPRVGYIRADVTRADDCQAMVARAVDTWGRVDILVNSAGVGDGAPIAEFAEDAWDRILDVNLKGTYLACRAAFPALAAHGGAIVNLASLAAMRAVPGMGAYAASKAGVVQFTRVLALEGAPAGIRANALCPVWIDTPMLRQYADRHPDPEATLRAMAAQIPLGRIGRADDIAGAALFLASDAAAFITGIALPVDGGALCA